MSTSAEITNYSAEYGFPNEPAFFTEAELDRLLTHAIHIGASDVHLQTEEPIFFDIQGLMPRVTYRNITNAEIDILTNIFYGANGTSRIARGEDIDTSYQVNEGSTFHRFRVNITACRSYGARGAQITIRTIRSTPVPLSEQNVEAEIIANFKQDNGLVLVCGPTGSGKSTLLAGMIRAIAEDPESHEKIITYEAPIEFVYDNVERHSTVIVQHEIPRDLPTFAAAVRNALRRAPGKMLVGESRDAETVEASLVAAETGHGLYTTLHTNSVPETLYRLVNLFSPEERSTKMFEIIEALRLVVVQLLVRRADGSGRYPLREFLTFDQKIRDRLRHAQSLKEAVGLVGQFVESKGQSMAAAALRAFNEGIIDERTCAKFEAGKRSALIDDLDITF